MFEVGKRYKSKLNHLLVLITAIGIKKVLASCDGLEFSINKDEFFNYEEVEPKRKIEKWVNVYDYNDKFVFGSVVDTKADAIRLVGSNHKYIDTIKFEYEEK